MKLSTMNGPWRLGAALIAFAAIGGCDQLQVETEPRPAGISNRRIDAATFDAGLDPDDERIVALVAWLGQKGVTLECIRNDEGYGAWKVTKPPISTEYDVVFSIRSFPSWASEEQMREALDINLAYMLNAPTHLAMSYAMINSTHPDSAGLKSDEELPTVNGLPVTKAVEELFKQYRRD